MSRTIKTYPDGSELTTTGVAAIVGLALLGSAISAAVCLKLEERSVRKMMQKAVDTLNEK